jgi:glucosamine--fructose-6-phosphate aminotransferase (isomerizing)
MTKNYLLDEIRSLSSQISPSLAHYASKAADIDFLAHFDDIEQVYLVGCGDSFHAGLCSEMFFQQTTGLGCRAMSSMAFSRYQSGYIRIRPEKTLVIGVSSSGKVSRTIEALDLAGRAGAVTVGITTDKTSLLAEAADHIFNFHLPSIFGEDESRIIPGCRSFIASLLALYFFAARLAEAAGNSSDSMVMEKVLDPDLISERISKTINLAEDGAKKAAADWQEADYFVFCGAGPNYGSACYSAAKILEASGTAAFGQDLEEWAHLQYFDRNQKVPTIVLSADGWDGDRVAEIVVAAETVGCDAALIAPSGSSMINKVGQVRILQVDGPINEAISPLFTTIPGMLLAAYHSQYMGEKYFRGFGGGRSLEGGGGISRIQSSHRQTTLRR